MSGSSTFKQETHLMRKHPFPCFFQLCAAEPATSGNPDPSQHASGCPRPSDRLSSRNSLGLRLHTEPAFIHEAAEPPPPPPPQQTDALRSEISHHASVPADAEPPLHEPADVPHQDAGEPEEADGTQQDVGEPPAEQKLDGK
ncbi:uncharacterized protein [Embiotoca jacksoni]|uniref:uncharacterized protein isoform X1 n=1 Tax=Embiotoca jacksoni TaxID=100190 RepID=UPI003703D929